MNAQWFDLTINLEVADLTPPTTCCFCDDSRPVWVWQCRPFVYPLGSAADPDGSSLVQLGQWTSSVWLSCSTCYRLEYRQRYGQLLTRAVAARLFRDPALQEHVLKLPEFLEAYFGCARRSFVGEATLLPADFGR